MPMNYGFGAVSPRRKQAKQTPRERWAEVVDGVIERFKADMANRYADEDADCCPLASTESDFHAPNDPGATPTANRML